MAYFVSWIVSSQVGKVVTADRIMGREETHRGSRTPSERMTREDYDSLKKELRKE